MEVRGEKAGGKKIIRGKRPTFQREKISLQEKKRLKIEKGE